MLLLIDKLCFLKVHFPDNKIEYDSCLKDKGLAFSKSLNEFGINALKQFFLLFKKFKSFN